MFWHQKAEEHSRYRKVIYCLDVADRLQNLGSGMLSFSICCHMTNGPVSCLEYDYPELEGQEMGLWQEFQFQKRSCYLMLTESA